MEQVSRWHNFSPAMKKKMHRAPTGIKREKGGKVNLVLALPWSLYWNGTANRPLKAKSLPEVCGQTIENIIPLFWAVNFTDFLLYQEHHIPLNTYEKDMSP